MRWAFFALVYFSITGCFTSSRGPTSTIARAVTRSSPPMKTTCSKARKTFVESKYTSAQLQEGSRELEGRHLVWQVRVLDVQKDYWRDSSNWKLVLVAECADSGEATVPFEVRAEFDTIDLVTTAKRDDLLALEKGAVIDLEGIFEGVDETLGVPHFDRVVVRGLDVRRGE